MKSTVTIFFCFNFIQLDDKPHNFKGDGITTF